MKFTTSLRSREGRSNAGWVIVRLTLAVLIAAHGWVRWLGGGVAPFGEWLGGQGLPSGYAIAVAITAFEIVGSLLLAWGRLVLPLTVIYALIYATGIAMIHAKAGWFVVGPGRNGAEFSVLLIACLIGLGLQHFRVGPPANAAGGLEGTVSSVGRAAQRED